MKLVIDPADLASFQRKMEALPRRVQIKTLRIALNAWGGIVRDKQKALAQKETGLLSRTLGVKVTIPDASRNKAHHGKPAYVVVGPKRKSGRFMRLNSKGSLIGFGKANKELKTNRNFFRAQGSSGRATEIGAVKATRKAFGNAVYRNPTRYIHLVEKGHRRGKGRSSARAYPMIGPSQQVGNTTGLAKFKSKLGEGIETEARLLAGIK